MTQNHISTEPEADGSALQPLDDDAPLVVEPPFPDYETDAEIDAFWDGVTHGIRRTGGFVPEEEAALRWRTDGWTPERQRRFLIVLSMTGSVTEACGEVGLSRESAYRLRRKPEGRLFARLWDAARLIARDRLADEAIERAMKGTVETVVYHGEEVGTRQRHDNRHLQWTLGRLDREASRYEEQSAPARRAAGAFDALLEMLGGDAEDAETMLGVLDEDTGDQRWRRPPPEDEASLIARFEEARELLRIENSDPADIDVSDLDPAEQDEWSDLDWARAERSGLLEEMEEEEEG